MKRFDFSDTFSDHSSFPPSSASCSFILHLSCPPLSLLNISPNPIASARSAPRRKARAHSLRPGCCARANCRRLLARPGSLVGETARRLAANPMLRIGEKDHGNRDGEELWALRDVSFTVEQGEALGIPSITLTSSRCLSGGQASVATAQGRAPCSRFSRALPRRHRARSRSRAGLPACWKWAPVSTPILRQAQDKPDRAREYLPERRNFRHDPPGSDPQVR